MALNKDQRFEDKNYRRDSFDDRIYDDLSEVILQYLSFKDKLRMESVSKQFQRTVFCKEERLNFELENVMQMQILLKKLPSITSITDMFVIYITGSRIISRRLLNESF